MNLQDELLLRPDIWQEYDCPATGIDFDLADDDILVVGQTFHCSGCGQNHIATPDLVQCTCLRLDDGELIFRGVPIDSAEKLDWLADVDQARQRFTALLASSGST